MPKKFLVHGWWLVFGEKMSKSIGNFVAPVRYHLMREMTVGQDCDFSAKRFIARYNSDPLNFVSIEGLLYKALLINIFSLKIINLNFF